MSVAVANGGGQVSRRRGAKRILLGATLIAVAVHAVVFLTLGIDVTPRKSRLPKEPFVALVHSANSEGNLVVGEQLEYLDPEPLFMPTAWNAGDQPLPPDLRRQPDQAFQSFEPQMTFAYNKLEPVFTPPSVGINEPMRALDLGGLPRFSSVGREDLMSGSLEREGYIEVRRISNGGIAYAGPLTSMPAATKDVQWRPIQILVAVNSAGMVGAPVIESGSGSTEIDDQIQVYLEAVYRLGNRLSPGFYRVTVGP